MKQKLVKGNEAVVFGALIGGATHFFGYPITPASEIAHAAAYYFTSAGRVFLQAESEVSSINMVYGAASAGARVMTASSGPGIALMSEGLSYLAGAELPAVVVDVQRAGPGLGNIWPEQSDYNMVVKGGGHGNYRNVVYAPNSAQEMCDFAYRAFDVAERFRMTVFLLADAYIGQMMEPIAFPTAVQHLDRRPWAVYADRDSRDRLITSIFMSQAEQSRHNEKLQAKYAEVERHLCEWEEFKTNDAEVLVIAFGIMSRICHSSVELLRERGIRAGLLRPKTLYPFPVARISALSERTHAVAVAELSNGQMAEDVDRASKCGREVIRCNWYGGIVPSENEVAGRIAEAVDGAV